MKRRLLIVAVFLLAGAVVNVAVAWGCAIWIPTSWPSMEEQYRDDNVGELKGDGNWHYWRIARWGRPGATYCYSQLAIMRQRSFARTFTELHPSELAPYWADLRTRPAGTGERCVHALGWPVVSMWCDYDVDGRPYELLHGLRIPFLPADGDYPQAVPLIPIWPAFAINTLFYAVVLWLLICGPFVLRRFIRVKRGLCPACAYPRGESDVCSECGKALPARARVVT